jgi:hypothetical protein
VNPETVPHWEHGYRCHGYWLGVVRWGFIGITAHRFGRIDGYGWEFHPHGIVSQNPVRGTTKTLRAAKRAVEREYEKYVACRA